MRRRAFALGALGAVTALAGCSSTSSDEEQAVNYSTITTETTLEVHISNPSKISDIHFSPENSEPKTDSITDEKPHGEYQLATREELGTANQPIHNTETIEIEFLNDDNIVDRTTWTYEPHIELTSIEHLSENSPIVDEAIQPATPIFEISNTGTGPVKLDEFVIHNPSSRILLEGGEHESFARAVLAYGPNNDDVELTAESSDDFIIPGNESIHIAVKNYLTHEGTEPTEVETANQYFDVSLRWIFDESWYDVKLTLTDGISKADMKYYFNDFEVSRIDTASPLDP